MALSDLSTALNEHLFPGNADAYDQLRSVVNAGDLTLFTGAGVSAPKLPTWTSFLSEQLEKCATEGSILKSDVSEIRSLLVSDPLELAGIIEQATTTPIFRSRIGSFFRNDGICTECHDVIAAMAVKAIVTLNYDFGHEIAHGKFGKFATSERAQDGSALSRWSQNDINSEPLSILHLHGDSNNSASMILTADDYDRFYGQPPVQALISQLWRTHQLLVVGFGFSDPFLTRVAESALRQLTTDHRHFAFIGTPVGEGLSPWKRSLFAKKYRLRPIFYQVKNDGSDHSDLLTLLRGLDNTDANTDILNHTEPQLDQQQLVATPSTAEINFRKDLHVAPNNNTLYVDPHFTKESEASDNEAATEYSIADLVNANTSIMLLCKPEYGATTVARRLEVEINQTGRTTLIANANDLPNYKRKLEAHFQASGFTSGRAGQVLVLDDFDPIGAERLLKEIIGTKIFEKLVIIVMESMFENRTAMSWEQLPITIEWYRLSPLSRADIRTLTIQFHDTSDNDTISSIVEKVYTDLLNLCIPITPANVIMYLTVLVKDDHFQPLNRVQIVNRYITALLSRPSDAMGASFTANNKMDVISAFVFYLEQKPTSVFTSTDWHIFCREYMEQTLTNFDDRRLLTILTSTRVLVTFDDKLFFKYRFFYTFFLGRHVAHRPKLLSSFTDDNKYLRHKGLVEVMADMTPDNEPLVTDIVEKLEAALAEFDQRYIPQSFDPFSELQWPQDKDEQETLWKPLAEKVAAGPRNVDEIDVIKRSLTEENRAANQNIIVQDFDRLEQRLVFLEVALAAAIQSADALPASLKKRAVMACIKCYLVYLQVGMLLAPSIAKTAYFRWHGIAFIDFNRASAEVDDEKKKHICYDVYLVRDPDDGRRPFRLKEDWRSFQSFRQRP